MQIFFTNCVELSFWLQSWEHFWYDGVICSEQWKEINVSLGFVVEDGFDFGVLINESDCFQELFFPFSIAISNITHQFREMVVVNTELLKNAVYQSQKPRTAATEVLKVALKMH